MRACAPRYIYGAPYPSATAAAGSLGAVLGGPGLARLAPPPARPASRRPGAPAASPAWGHGTRSVRREAGGRGAGAEAGAGGARNPQILSSGAGVGQSASIAPTRGGPGREKLSASQPSPTSTCGTPPSPHIFYTFSWGSRVGSPGSRALGSPAGRLPFGEFQEVLGQGAAAGSWEQRIDCTPSPALERVWNGHGSFPRARNWSDVFSFKNLKQFLKQIIYAELLNLCHAHMLSQSSFNVFTFPLNIFCMPE